MSADLWLVAGTAERTARIVWIGRDGAWKYDTPNGLAAFRTEAEADEYRLSSDGFMSSLFGGIFGTAPASTQRHPTPTLKNVRVVRFGRKAR